MKNKFSIIIPLYNKEEYILNTLKSILIQEYLDYEVLVIDDSSTDSSYDLVQNFITQNNLLNYSLYKNERNSGVSFSRNRGIELSKGNYIIFLDADDELIRRDFLSVINNFIAKHTSEYIVISRNYYGRYIKPRVRFRKGYISAIEKNFYQITNKIFFAEDMSFPFGGSASAVLSRRLINSKRFNVDEMCFEDWEFFFDRYIKSEPSYCSVPFIKINYVPNSLSNQKKANTGLWVLPSFYHYLDENKIISLRKKFFWIWLANNLKRNQTSKNVKENVSEHKNEIRKNLVLSKYFLYSMVKIAYSFVSLQ